MNLGFTKLATIPKVFRGLLTGFLILITLRVTTPIATYIFGIFDAGIMKVAAILAYYIVIIFVCWLS